MKGGEKKKKGKLKDKQPHVNALHKIYMNSLTRNIVKSKTVLVFSKERHNSAKSKYLTSKIKVLEGLLSIILQGTSELLPLRI